MMRVYGSAVAGELAQDGRAAPARPVQSFQRQDCRAFTQRQSIAPGIERAASRGRKNLQRIEAGKNQFTHGVIPTCQRAFSLAVTDQFPRLADGVAAGRAGVGDNGDGAVETERVGNQTRLDLWLVKNRARGLPAVVKGLLGGSER